MSKLLFDESPLVVDVQLATKLGVDAAIVLQQIHYWIEINKRKQLNYYDNAYWTYNSIKEWNKTFPFYTERTLQRIFKKLKDTGILIAGNFNKAKFDKTTWYTINYEKLRRIVEGLEEMQGSRQNGNIEERKCVNDDDKMAERERQSGNTTAPNWHNVDDKLATPIPEISTETSSKTSPKTSSSSMMDEDERKKVSVGVQEVIKFFENNFYMLKSFDVEVISEWCKQYLPEIVIEAMKIAKKNNARALNYIERILINWEHEGINTLEALDNYLAAKEVSKHGCNQPSSTQQCRAGDAQDEDDVSRTLRKAGRGVRFEDDEQYDY